MLVLHAREEEEGREEGREKGREGRERGCGDALYYVIAEQEVKQIYSLVK